MKILKKITYNEFYNVNEFVAKTSPMRTHYDSANPLERLLWARKKQIVGEIIKNLPIKTLLDVGCGDGRLIDEIPLNVNYTGIDISPTQIKEAGKYMEVIKSKRRELVIGDVTKMPFKNNSFNAALACDIVEHVINPKQLFKELKRVVKKNGFIIFGIPNEFLWELSRLVLLKFPLRSPDHINAIFEKDIANEFPIISKKVFLPVSFSSKMSLIHVYLVKNDK